MYCRKCGKQIKDVGMFCKYCGANIVFEEPEAFNENIQELVQQEDYANDIDVVPVKIKQHSMRWYKALTNFIIPATLILRPIEVFGNLSLQAKQTYGSWKNYFTDSIDGLPNTLNIMIWLFGMILLLSAYREIKKFTKLGYKCIIAFFIFNICYPIISALIYTPSYAKVGINYNYGQVVAQVIINLIVGIPNIIYFKKRKYLFSDNEIHSL